MWLNLKPSTTQLYGPKAIPYNIGISNPGNVVDQKRNTIRVRPGEETQINVIPRVVETSDDYNGLPLDQRRCKLSQEKEGLNFLSNYTRIGCEMECAMEQAISICECIPWYYPNDPNGLPMCEMFGAFCFDIIMSEDSYYRSCKFRCLTDCHETAYIVLPEYFPINEDKACLDYSFHGLYFRRNFQRHFAFHNYKTLVESGSVPDLVTSFSNGSLCKDYIRNYAALITINSPSSKIILTKRDKAVFFYDKIGTIGGTGGLFVGMSFISFGEVGILLFDIFYQIWKLCKDPFKNRREAKKNEPERIDQLQDAIFVSFIVSLINHL